MVKKTFAESDLSSLVGKTIFLDIDGTLVIDGEEKLNAVESQKLMSLRDRNTIYLVSNKKNHGRNERVARQFGVTYVPSPFHKPSRKILEQIPVPQGAVVIGDKYLTDGLLAKNIGAEYKAVESLRSPHESFATRVSYFIDAVAAFVMETPRVCAFVLGILTAVIFGLIAEYSYRYLAADSFTYFTMARQFYETGMLFSFTGIDHTTGIHPGFYFLLLPLYALVTFDIPVWSFVLCGLVLFCAFWALYRVMGVYAMLCGAFLTLTFYGLSLTNNGMESSAAFLGLALVFLAYTTYEKKSTVHNALLLGLLLGVMVFFRLDLIFVAGALYLMLFFRMVMLYVGKKPIREHVVHAAISGVPLGVILFGILALNYVYGGSPVPISGILKSSFPHIDPLWFDKLIAMKIFFIAMGVTSLYALYEFVTFKRVHTFILVLLIGCGIQYAYNVFFVSGIGAWYGTFPFFCILVVVGFALNMSRFKAEIATLVCLGLVPLILYTHFSREDVDWVSPHARAALFLQDHAVAGERASELKDGVFAFYSPVPVYSLTGLANNQEYVTAVKENAIFEYLEKNQIKYVAAGDIRSGVQVPGGEGLFADCRDPLYDTGIVKLYRIESCLKPYNR